MTEEDKCTVTFAREEMLRNPDLLKTLYSVFGQEQILNWILKREVKNPEEGKQEPATEDPNVCPANPCSEC